VSPHKKDEQIKKQLDESNISEFDYLRVSIMDVDPIKINEEKLRSSYLFRKPANSKTEERTKIQNFHFANSKRRNL
jgi:hypothetical protein